jgi:hypothetical protein
MRWICVALLVACGSAQPPRNSEPVVAEGLGPCCMGDSETCAPDGVLAQLHHTRTEVGFSLSEQERDRLQEIDESGTRTGGVRAARAAKLAEADAVVRVLAPIDLERNGYGAQAAELRALAEIHDDHTAERALLAIDAVASAIEAQGPESRPSELPESIAIASRAIDSVALPDDTDVACYLDFERSDEAADLARVLLASEPRGPVVAALLAMFERMVAAARSTDQ